MLASISHMEEPASSDATAVAGLSPKSSVQGDPFPLRLPDERQSGQAYVPGTERRTQGIHDATSQVIGGDTASPTCLSNLDYCRRPSRSPNQ